MTSQHDQWLAQTVEEALEPNLPICDPHHHLWDWPDNRYARNRYLREELLQDTGSGHNIVKTVFVDCRSMYRTEGPEALRPVGETEFVQGVAGGLAADGYSLMNAIVGHADLRLGAAVEEVLEAHRAASPDRFRGIRHATAWQADTDSYGSSPPQLMLDPTFREGFAVLQKLNMTFDAWMYHHQLPDLVDLARAFPDAVIILDHIGGFRGTGSYAERREEVFQTWQKNMADVAACPNVVCKIGGIGSPFFGMGWHEQEKPPASTEIAAAMKPFYLYCIEQFGVDRCMFESNFPVDNASYSYAVMWNAYKRLTADFSTNERAALFHDTAARVYRIADA